MPLSMHQASAPLFRQGLTALSAVLDKAAAQCAERKIDPAVLLADRLAPDMFPFTRQVQLSCDFAKNAMSRLAGREPPKFEDVETTRPGAAGPDRAHACASSTRSRPARSTVRRAVRSPSLSAARA